jgi:hypothetical protein
MPAYGMDIALNRKVIKCMLILRLDDKHLCMSRLNDECMIKKIYRLGILQ